ncbi:DUF1304 domain-containing protein [Maritalea sp.]|uniref:DUF1304 domain-containing protein n=1 Tax=Maritalea sp. TaxID=2003361 RepID=UPI003EF222EA
MSVFSMVLVALIALLHFYILWFEMFAWESRGPKIFRSFPADLFTPTKAMAANQGLYNGFLAAGLIWSLMIGDAEWAKNVALFFLGCVFIAGVYGALTASKRILYVQSVPALIAILLVMFT